MRIIYFLGLSFIESSYNFGATLSICVPPLSLAIRTYFTCRIISSHVQQLFAYVFESTVNKSLHFTSVHPTSPHFTSLHHTSPHISPFFWHHYNTLCFRLEMISIYDFLISYLVVSFMAGQTFSLYLSLDLPISIFILLSTVIALSQLSFSYK